MFPGQPSGITHQHLLALMVRRPTDFEPYGDRNRDDDWGPDCSCGCRWFAKLAGKLGMDWGVCSNPASPRVWIRLVAKLPGCGYAAA